jgi:DNA polymerase III sliding clamp (beta) subunit (PCNA family)
LPSIIGKKGFLRIKAVKPDKLFLYYLDVEGSIPAVVQQEGTIIINAFGFINALKTFQNGLLYLKVNGRFLEMSQGNSNFMVECTSAIGIDQ